MASSYRPRYPPPVAEPAEPLPDNSGETAATRPDGMPVGKPFEPGASGNPKGRPRGLAAATRDVLKAAVEEGDDPAMALARFWASVMSDPQEKMPLRMQAADRLADRGWGKPPQYAPIEDEDPLDFSETASNAIVDSFDRTLDELEKKRVAREARKATAEAAT